MLFYYYILREKVKKFSAKKSLPFVVKYNNNCNISIYEYNVILLCYYSIYIIRYATSTIYNIIIMVCYYLFSQYCKCNNNVMMGQDNIIC